MYKLVQGQSQKLKKGDKKKNNTFRQERFFILIILQKHKLSCIYIL